MSQLLGFQEVMKDLLLQGHYSDMAIICQDFTFNVHRAIVCTQSTFFKAALSGSFKESDKQSVNLPDDDPEAIERVLSYLYLHDYQENGHLVQMDDKRLQEYPTIDHEPIAGEGPEGCPAEIENAKNIALNNLQVYIAGDKFDIIGLKSLSSEKFARWAKANWETPAFLDIANDVMTLVPRHDPVLQNIMVNIISENLYDLVKQGGILQLIENFGALGSAIITKLVEDGRIKQPSEVQASTLEQIARKVNHRVFCRHCSAALNVRMENGEYQYGTIRCAACHTRH